MAELQPRVVGNVVAFSTGLTRAAGASLSWLTARDRMDVAGWRDAARLAGYDRMMIHDCGPQDGIDSGDYLSVYRSGEVWSRWGFVRTGFAIRVWCCLTGSDIGEFDTLGEALAEVLHGAHRRAGRKLSMKQASAAGRPSAVITPFVPRPRPAHPT